MNHNDSNSAISKTEDDDYDDILVDIRSSLYESWRLAFVMAIICALISYKTVTSYQPRSPYHINEVSNKVIQSRTIPSLLDQESFRKIAKYMESSFFANGSYVFSLHFTNYSTKSKNIPTFFNSGLTFVLSTSNFFERHTVSVTNENKFENIKNDIMHMSTKPTCIFTRIGKYFVSDWYEHGVAAYFSFTDLQRQEMLSNDPEKPWNLVLDKIKLAIRKYDLLYVTIYYPHTWSAAENTTLLIQHIEPIRTGISLIHSKVPVDGVDDVVYSSNFENICKIIAD